MLKTKIYPHTKLKHQEMNTTIPSLTTIHNIQTKQSGSSQVDSTPRRYLRVFTPRQSFHNSAPLKQHSEVH